MRRFVPVALAVSVTAGCHADGDPPPSSQFPASEECNWVTSPQPADAGKPFCDLEFREVTRLEDVDSITPRPPVMLLRDGSYVTATYSPGKVALWSPDGELVNVIGKGAGEGPGEFDYASGLAQVVADEFLVFEGMPVVHRYETTGRFLRSIRLPTVGGAGSAVAYGGFAITTASTRSGRQGLLLTGDSVLAFGLRGRREAALLVAAAEDVGIWSAEHDRYVLRRHALPRGGIVDSIVVARDWFPGPEGNEAVIGRLHADGRGLIWTAVGAADPDAPSRDRTTGGERPVDIEEARASAARFRDRVVEAFAPDGRLVVSVRFDSYWDSGQPMHGNIWYRQSRDMLSIIVLEAVLTERYRRSAER